MTPRVRRQNRLAALVSEVTALRAKYVEQEMLSTAKDDAMREFVNTRIAIFKAATKSTNGIRRGESADSYRARLVEANRMAVTQKGLL